MMQSYSVVLIHIKIGVLINMKTVGARHLSQFRAPNFYAEDGGTASANIMVDLHGGS